MLRKYCCLTHTCKRDCFRIIEPWCHIDGIMRCNNLGRTKCDITKGLLVWNIWPANWFIYSIYTFLESENFVDHCICSHCVSPCLACPSVSTSALFVFAIRSNQPKQMGQPSRVRVCPRFLPTGKFFPATVPLPWRDLLLSLFDWTKHFKMPLDVIWGFI